MATIKSLSNHDLDFVTIIQMVANIEAMVQAQEAWSCQAMVDLLEQDNNHILIAYDKGKEEKIASHKIVGYCLYQIVFEQAEILRIGTRPKCQRQGIASQIFDKLNTELINKDVETLLLEVRADNAPAIALYEQQGFSMIYKRQGYYRIPNQPAIDALIMQRLL